MWETDLITIDVPAFNFFNEREQVLEPRLKLHLCKSFSFFFFFFALYDTPSYLNLVFRGMMELFGILVGHLYFFLMFKYPQDFGGAQLLTVPNFL